MEKETRLEAETRKIREACEAAVGPAAEYLQRAANRILSEINKARKRPTPEETDR